MHEKMDVLRDKGYAFVLVAAAEPTPDVIGYVDADLNEFAPTMRERKLGMLALGYAMEVRYRQALINKQRFVITGLFISVVAMLAVFYA